MRFALQNQCVLALRAVYDSLMAGNASASEWAASFDLVTDVIAELELESSRREESPDFDGETYDPAHDANRLNRQLGRVFEAMTDGVWRTLSEIAGVTDDPGASISARLRDLRKRRFGSYLVDRRIRGGRRRGLYEYRLLSPSGAVIRPHPVS